MQRPKNGGGEVKALAVVIGFTLLVFSAGYTMGRTSAEVDNYGEIYDQALSDAYDHINGVK